MSQQCEQFLEAILTFVRGMFWHDIAKPLYLGNEKHAAVGYAFLSALGCTKEALVALSHANPKTTLEQVFYRHHPAADHSLPSYLALTGALDVLASVTYSLEETDPGKNGLPKPSAQNPFTRLPLCDKDDKNLGLIASSSDPGVFTREKFAQHFWKMVESTLGYRPDLVKDDGGLANEDFNNAAAILSVLQSIPSAKIRAHLERYQYLCGERTYPAPNDTALREHTRLSAVLAYVVYANLLNRGDDFLRWRIYRDQYLGSWRLDAREDDYSLERFTRWEASPGAMRTVIANSDGQLVRVCFTGLQNLFDNAVRLDDLTGVRELLKPDDKSRPSLKTDFKRHFALALLRLSCPDATLADVEGGLPGGTLADILPLSEGLFDAIYLIPACHTKKAIEKAALDAYRAAWDEIITRRVIKVIWGDLADFAGVLKLAEWKDEIKTQLTGLPISIVVRRVKKPELEGDDFRKWMATFGDQLLQAFKDIREAVAVSREQMSGWLIQAEKERKEGLDTVCDVCGANPADPEFNSLVPIEPRLQIVVHRRGNEWEHICRGCIGLRALAHGVRKAEPLERMIQPQGTGHICVQDSKQKGDPKPPPGLPRGCFPLEKKEHKDLIAAFVRWREPGKSLEVFPTVSYAADDEGNVALLALTAGPALFEPYDYRRGREQAKARTGEDAGNWRKYFEGVVHWAEENRPELVEGMLKVESHQARVMTRIRLLDEFYQALPGKIERWKEPIRTLSLQAEYPLVRVLVPAARLPDALAALETSLSRDLFSALWEGCEKETRCLLAAILPPLLLSSVVVFKEKYPLYLALEAERVLMQRLAEAPANQYWSRPLGKKEEKPRPPDSWAGLRLGLCDLRGTLAAQGPWQGQILWKELGKVVQLEKSVDRVTVLRKGILEQEPEMKPLADALALIRANVVRGTDLKTVKCLENPSLFRPVLFLKRLTREGVR